jgi:hypothetical protein
MALVDILEQIFHGLNAAACLNINVAVESTYEIRVVQDNPSIVQHVTSNRLLTTIIAPPVHWVRILALRC